MRDWIDSTLCTLGIDALLRRRHRTGLRVFMYHGVVEQEIRPFCWHMLPRDRFERQIAWIAKHYVILPLHDALQRLESGTLPQHAAAITFDDGYRNNATIAAPILRKYGAPATIFLVIDRIGTRIPLWPDRLFVAFRDSIEDHVDLDMLGLGAHGLRTARENEAAYAATCLHLKSVQVEHWPERIDAIEQSLGVQPRDTEEPFRLMTWEDVEALGAAGDITFGPHSLTHPILSRCSDELAAQEIGGSCARMATLQASVPIFAYPNGRAQDFGRRSETLVGQAGLKWALSTEPGIVRRKDRALALPRISIGANTSWARFRLLASGWSA